MNGFCPRFAMRVHRFGEAIVPDKFYNQSRFGKKMRRVVFYLLRYLCIVSCKIFFQEGTVIGKDLRLSNKGNIIIGSEKIGDNCVIHHNVTFGLHLAGNKNFNGNPKVGDRVWIGPDTIIHGNIKIGDGVTILGSTVLTKNIPDCCVVCGNPGRIVYREFDNSRLIESSWHDVTLQMIKEWAVEDD
jgi:serine acetyltransferase